jgi:hypothetical protein
VLWLQELCSKKTDWYSGSSRYINKYGMNLLEMVGQSLMGINI